MGSLYRRWFYHYSCSRSTRERSSQRNSEGIPTDFINQGKRLVSKIICEDGRLRQSKIRLSIRAPVLCEDYKLLRWGKLLHMIDSLYRPRYEKTGSSGSGMTNVCITSYILNENGYTFKGDKCQNSFQGRQFCITPIIVCRGTVTFSRETTLLKCVCLPSEKGSTLIGKNILPKIVE